MIGPYVYFFVLAKQQHPVKSIRYCQTDYDLLQIAVFIQFWAMFSDSSSWLQLIYIRNVVIGLSFLCSCIQILDFLSFHHLFGPWAIIIR